MPARIQDILKIEVPIVVLLAERDMDVAEIVKITPGTLIELPKLADDELEVLVANKAIGVGSAVKVGENFGIRITYIGDLKSRIEALGPDDGSSAGSTDDGIDADAFAEALLSGNG